MLFLRFYERKRKPKLWFKKKIKEHENIVTNTWSNFFIDFEIFWCRSFSLGIFFGNEKANSSVCGQNCIYLESFLKLIIQKHMIENSFNKKFTSLGAPASNIATKQILWTFFDREHKRYWAKQTTRKHFCNIILFTFLQHLTFLVLSVESDSESGRES